MIKVKARTLIKIAVFFIIVLFFTVAVKAGKLDYKHFLNYDAFLRFCPEKVKIVEKPVIVMVTPTLTPTPTPKYKKTAVTTSSAVRK